MTIVMPKNPTKKQVAAAVKKLQTSLKRKKGGGNIARHFGSNKKEVDGLAFQKKVRKEWINNC